MVAGQTAKSKPLSWRSAARSAVPICNPGSAVPVSDQKARCRSIAICNGRHRIDVEVIGRLRSRAWGFRNEVSVKSQLFVGCAKALIFTMLLPISVAGAQQAVTPTPAPPPGTVPITSQTPLTSGQDPTAPTVAPASNSQRKAEHTAQKQQEKVAHENSRAAQS